MVDRRRLTALHAYLSGLSISQGRLAGQAFNVLPWQARFVRGAFAPATTSAALSVARGNGKTSLLSAIACATLDGPLMVPRGETVIVASSFEQARIGFEHVIAFMGDKLDDKQPVEGLGHGATSADRGPQDGRAGALHRLRSATGAWPGAGACSGRRARPVAGNHRRAHGCGAADGGGQATP